jgi:pimeloyl-ACP methyl ester carboxylesterase
VIDFNGYHEEAMFFGPKDSLFGIATLPEVKSKETGVVWLNTANDHRVGPNRSYVPLARTLARLGYASFRFDPRDVGDGAPASGSHAYSMDRHADVERAIDFFHDHYGIKKLVLVGLCSGAYMAFHFGTKDPRVVGEVIVNPQTFAWKEGDSFDLIARTYRSVRAYKGMLSNPRTWRRALKGQVRVGAIGLAVGRQLVARGKNWLYSYLPATPGQPLNIKRALRSKLQRGLKVLFVLAENDGAMDFVEQHLGHRARSLSSHAGFRFEAVPGVDHTFSQRWAKDQLSALVVSHMTRHFP